MSRVPHHVQKMLDFNVTIQRAEDHARELKKGTLHADWAQKDFQKLQALAEGKVLNPTMLQRFDNGVQQGIVTVKAKRQARLKELYEREALQYESELNALGLSLVKPKD